MLKETNEETFASMLEFRLEADVNFKFMSEQ